MKINHLNESKSMRFRLVDDINNDTHSDNTKAPPLYIVSPECIYTIDIPMTQLAYILQTQEPSLPPPYAVRDGRMLEAKPNSKNRLHR